MINGIEEYYQLTKQPWGKLFYETIWEQIDIVNGKTCNILDFGSGFGITAKHYSENHNVIAVEPNPLMLERRITGGYEQLTGGIEHVIAFPDNYFDFVICHNVLEYCENREQIFKELARVIRSKGRLSLIKHNKEGKVIHTAVFDANPRKAVELLKDIDTDCSKSFGKRHVYSEEELIKWAENSGMGIVKKYGVRTFFSLIQDNSIKYDADWYSDMLMLERAVSGTEPYRSIAFFHHYILIKN